MRSTMEESCRCEIKRLHEFFVEWFTAAIGRDEWDRCDQVLAEEMVMISPSGTLSNHSQLVEQLRAAYGSHRGKHFSIEIRNMQLRVVQEENWCMFTYEEWQVLDAVSTSRRSTALFRSKEHTPHGVEWVHLQETCMNSGKQTPSPTTTVVDKPVLERTPSLVSKRRHLSPQLPPSTRMIEREGELVGIELEGWKISSQQGCIGDDAWFSQATERLQELAQPPPEAERAESHSLAYRHLCLPEMVFPRAHTTLEKSNGLKLKFGAYPALLEWAQAHRSIPLGSFQQHRGVSVLQTADAKLWSGKTVGHSNFHYDWTFSTPHACTTTMDVSWTPLETSGMNLALLQDQSVPILLFDEVVLYEDDLHDNGQATLTCKIRVMPTCAFVLEQLWVRVDRVLLRVRDTRVSLEFGSNQIFRDVVWRQCTWEDLEKNGLPTNVKSWCPETGGVSKDEWQTMLLRLPQVPLPNDLPAFAVLDETSS
jgi:type 2A phosphatase activator TIP41